MNKASTLNKSHQTQHFVIIVAAVAAFGGLLFGFDTGVISGAILFIHDQFHLSPFANGLVVSAVLFGAFLGAAFSGHFSDILGRRKILIITSLIFGISTIGSAIAPTVFWLIFSRIIVGIAIGIASFVTPLYISEIAPQELRGTLVTFNQLLVTVGIVTSYLVDYAFAAQGAWRLMLAFGVIPAICLFLGMLFLPESPRWMIANGQEAIARKTLKSIRAKQNIEDEVSAIKYSLNQQHGNWRMLFQPWVMPAIIVGFGLAIFQQLAGINTLIYYAPTIFKLAGFHQSATAILATLGIGIINVIFTIVSMPLLDRLGRRPLLLIGTIGMAISLAILGLSFKFGGHSAALKWMALGSMILYIPCFAISLGPIMWLMISEIFPLKIRGLASSLSGSINWAFNMIVALTFLSLVHFAGKSGTFFLFSSICILCMFFIYFFVPETKGISLEQIEENLRAGKKSRHIGV